MKFLLPHQFKKVGFIISPIGIVLWIAMQLNYISRLLALIFNESATPEVVPSYYQTVNITIAVIGFFSFLVGLYFIAFSKEKVEDEMVQRTRLDSFQFAALMQILFVITGFLCMLLYKDPGQEGLMLFFITVVVLFWVSFISRFNYILHIKLCR